MHLDDRGEVFFSPGGQELAPGAEALSPGARFFGGGVGGGVSFAEGLRLSEPSWALPQSWPKNPSVSWWPPSHAVQLTLLDLFGWFGGWVSVFEPLNGE